MQPRPRAQDRGQEGTPLRKEQSESNGYRAAAQTESQCRLPWQSADIFMDGLTGFDSCRLEAIVGRQRVLLDGCSRMVRSCQTGRRALSGASVSISARRTSRMQGIRTGCPVGHLTPLGILIEELLIDRCYLSTTFRRHHSEARNGFVRQPDAQDIPAAPKRPSSPATWTAPMTSGPPSSSPPPSRWAPPPPRTSGRAMEG